MTDEDKTVDDFKEDVLRIRREKMRASIVLINLEAEEHNALNLVRLSCPTRIEDPTSIIKNTDCCTHDTESHKTCNVWACPMFSVIENAAGREI